MDDVGLESGGTSGQDMSFSSAGPQRKKWANTAAACIALMSFIALVVASVALSKVNRSVAGPPPPPALGVIAGTGGMVTSANQMATNAGLDGT